MRYVFLVVAFFVQVSVQANDEWFRYTSISPDGTSIAFTYKGDIYTVPSVGGEARPLTFHKDHDYEAVWSNDGTKICFASNRYGNFDLFIIDVQKGGEVKRLTFHSNNETPYTFSEDDKYVIFGGQRLDDVNHRQYPTGSQPELYKVPVDGGRVQQIFTIPAEYAKVSSDGSLMLYHDKKGGENTFRKHHKSAITRDIWKYDVKNKMHTMITSFKGEDRHPVFSPDEKTIYFLSERSGTFNVHSMDLNGQNAQQISDFKEHPVRSLSISKNGLLCYTYNGSIYTQKVGAEPVKINVHVRTGAKTNRHQLINVSGNVSEMAVSPDGKEVAYIVRGEVFVSSVKGKMHKRITNTPAPERFVSFSPDGKHILYASERDAKWSIYQTSKVNDHEPYFFASTLLKEEAVIENINSNYEPKYSPDGKEIAYIENRSTLKTYNVESKKTRTLLDGDKLLYMSEGDQYFTWSPDSKWLLVEYSPVLANSEVLLVSANKPDSVVNLTESGYGDYSPQWADEGKQILWFSDRHGLRSSANSGSRQLDVYSMFLTKEAWDRFNLSKDEYELLKEIEDKEKEDKEGKEKDKTKEEKKGKEEEIKPVEVKIELDGIENRKERLTIHSSRLGDAVLSKDVQELYYLARFEKGMNLWKTNLRTKETKMLVKLGVKKGSLQWDEKMEQLFLLGDGRISKIDIEKGSSKGISLGGEISLDVVAERQQMFDHVYERNKGMFYISDYHGADWEKLRANYEPKLKNIGNDFEFTELLSEMLGELNVSHSGARYYHRAPNGDKTASLGTFIDYDYEGQGIKITEIIKGGPLDKSDLDVEKGMIITEIDGEPITDTDYAKYLNRKAGKYTALKLYGKGKKDFYVTVKPISLGEQRTLLYDRWVKQNEKDVERLSNGTLGYVHLSGMNDGVFRNVYEHVMGKYYDAKGLIVDTRFNGGGDLVGDLSMFLTGDNFIEYAIEGRTVGYEPSFRWTKPSVALANEANYSDGHCFSSMYTDLNIGELIGMPVPGTCSFAGWEMLQNGKVLWGSIPVSARNKAGEWLENNETQPDIQVKNMPDKITKGVDQQLETAVKVLMKKVK
ncbi:C-terminal processing protease CtpA/Prc [Balneicella halophila]|uniref:Tricorn protease homolog n=1 Tax=Balneicella halophila TaxID=1537566 RepID=A0A7L4UN38_BALHA|nr:S41 family peptidase [Balneicella halophila]PVX50044.1 C-terminal processing protease CtpA/Prc [Balneicella halophila]